MFIDGAPFGPVSALCAPALQLGRAAAAAMADRGRRALPMENRLCNARCVKTLRRGNKRAKARLCWPCREKCVPRAAPPAPLPRARSAATRAPRGTGTMLRAGVDAAGRAGRCGGAAFARASTPSRAMPLACRKLACVAPRPKQRCLARTLRRRLPARRAHAGVTESASRMRGIETLKSEVGLAARQAPGLHASRYLLGARLGEATGAAPWARRLCVRPMHLH